MNFDQTVVHHFPEILPHAVPSALSQDNSKVGPPFVRVIYLRKPALSLLFPIAASQWPSRIA